MTGTQFLENGTLLTTGSAVYQSDDKGVSFHILFPPENSILYVTNQKENSKAYFVVDQSVLSLDVTDYVSGVEFICTQIYVLTTSSYRSSRLWQSSDAGATFN